jgi:hypothetical protein
MSVQSVQHEALPLDQGASQPVETGSTAFTVWHIESLDAARRAGCDLMVTLESVMHANAERILEDWGMVVMYPHEYARHVKAGTLPRRRKR